MFGRTIVHNFNCAMRCHAMCDVPRTMECADGIKYVCVCGVCIMCNLCMCSAVQQLQVFIARREHRDRRYYMDVGPHLQVHAK